MALPLPSEDAALVAAQAALQDAQLVERVRRGDGEAYGELVTRHMHRAFAIAYRLVQHREDAEDVTQDAFIRALEKIDMLDRGRPFHPWFYRIVVNGALNHRRSRSLRSTDAIPDGHAAAGPLPDRSTEDAQLRERLDAAMAMLPERQRVILVLADIEEFTSVEIAEMLDIADGTVRWHLHQARRTLREALATLKEEAR